jgi:hypothetical protein
MILDIRSAGLTMTRTHECLSSLFSVTGDSHDGDRLQSLSNTVCKPAPKARALLRALLVVVLLMMGPCATFAQGQTPASASAEEELAAEFTDPLTTLPQIFVKDAYSPANFGTHVQTNQALARAIIPRVPRFSLFPFVQLVRPTFSLVTVPSARGGTRTELGDTQVFDVAVLPWPGEKTGLRIGLGPMFVFPTATSRSAGQGAWQAGPTFAAAYTGIPWLLMGFLFQNPISFAYTSPNRKPQNTVEFQPVLLLHLWQGWYVRSAEATWLVNWRHHSPTMLPLSLGIGKVMVRPGLPPLNFYVSGQWMVYRQFAPIAPQTTVSFGLTVAFPEFRKW